MLSEEWHLLAYWEHCFLLSNIFSPNILPARYVPTYTSGFYSNTLDIVMLEQSVLEEGLTLETSAKHHIPQAKNIPYQPSYQTHIQRTRPHRKKVFFKTSLPVFDKGSLPMLSNKNLCDRTIRHSRTEQQTSCK